MFEVGPNLWLQSFDTPWLLWLMIAVSELGTSAFYMAAFLVLAFGIRLRPMLGVSLAMVLAGIATHAFKAGFALPRPSEVDARVLHKGETGRALVEDGAADTFWALPSDEAIAKVRAAGEMDYGFISGHASAATAFALGLVVFFSLRQRPAWGFAIGWALVMGVSRMYLGRHFTADILGGWVIGGLAVWLAWMFVHAVSGEAANARRRAWKAAGVLVAALLIVSLQVPLVDPGSAGQLLGILACLYVVTDCGTVDESGLAQRLLRVVLAFGLGYGLDLTLSMVWDAGAWPDRHPLSFLFAAIGYPAAILGTFFVARRLELYRPATSAA